MIYKAGQEPVGVGLAGLAWLGRSPRKRGGTYCIRYEAAPRCGGVEVESEVEAETDTPTHPHAPTLHHLAQLRHQTSGVD